MTDTKRETAAAVFPIDPEAVLMERLQKVIEDETGTLQVDLRRGRGQFSVYLRLANGKEITHSGGASGWRVTLIKALEWWDEATGGPTD